MALINARVDGEAPQQIQLPAFLYNQLFPSGGDEYATCLQMGYEMPPKLYCSRGFCKAVLLGEQQCLKSVNVKRVYLKKYDSASISGLMELLNNNRADSDRIKPYLPRKRNNNAKPPKVHREWIFNLANTLCPDTFALFKQ